VQTSLLRPAQPHPNPSRIPDRWIQAERKSVSSAPKACRSREIGDRVGFHWIRVQQILCEEQQQQA
jgi:hypothetical protein